MRSRWLSLGAVLLALLAACIWAGFSSQDVHRTYLKEGGPVEIASAIGYFVCLALLLVMGAGYARRFPHIPLFVALLGLRELDFDKRFTTMGIFKTQFFASSEVPVVEKAIGLVVIAICAWVLWAIFKHHMRPALKDPIGAIRRYPEPLACGFVLLVASGLDGLGRKLGGVGIALGQSIERAAGGIEEILELGVPVILILALLAHIREERRQQDSAA